MPKLTADTIKSRKNQLLKAALACFARDGYHRTTMDEVVGQAGLSKGSLYTHFESKKALYLALLKNMLTDTRLESVLSRQDGSGLERLQAAMAAMVGFTASVEYHNYAALLMDAWALAQTDQDVRQTLNQIYRQLRFLFRQSIQAGTDQGEFIPVDADALASAFISIFDGLMVQYMLDGDAIDWQVAAGAVQDSWMDGLLRRT